MRILTARTVAHYLHSFYMTGQEKKPVTRVVLCQGITKDTRKLSKDKHLYALNSHA